MAGRRGRPAQDYSQADRLIKIVELLNAGKPVTVPALIEQFGVSRRTINRDLIVLHRRGKVRPGQYGADGHKAWLSGGTPEGESLKLTHQELVTLHFVRSHFAWLGETALAESLEKVFEKLGQALGKLSLRGKAARLHRSAWERKLYAVAPAAKPVDDEQSDVLDDIISALVKDDELKITYQKIDAPAQKGLRVRPLSLVADHGGLYMVAESAVGEPVRKVYALERIKEAKWLSKSGFVYPDDYDPAAYFATAFRVDVRNDPQHIELLFDAKAAPYVRARSWHATQEVELFDDGRLLLALDCDITPELVRWLSEWGPSLRVLAPASLAATLKVQAAETAALYDTPVPELPGAAKRAKRAAKREAKAAEAAARAAAAPGELHRREGTAEGT